MCTLERQAGLSLAELLIFIVVVGVAVTGVLSAMNFATQHSADPLLRKQALAVADSLLEEILAHAYADPDGVEPEASRPLYDDVGDYHGLTMSGIRDLQGDAVAGLEDYDAQVAVAAASLGGATAKRITVTVYAPDGNGLTMTGYRMEYP